MQYEASFISVGMLISLFVCMGEYRDDYSTFQAIEKVLWVNLIMWTIVEIIDYLVKKIMRTCVEKGLTRLFS